MKTVQKLLIAIRDDLQEYLNGTPITEMHIGIVNRLLDLLNDCKPLYVDTDSVKCVPGYPEVRPDIYAPDPDDAEDKDAENTLEDFDTGEIEKAMEQPLDINSRKPFIPELMGIYTLAGTQYKYQCIAIDDVYRTFTMRNIETGWVCDAHAMRIYNNYSIDWSYSTNGHFDKE
jgi:hypothetical protein